jgi:hypothetical protein
MRAGPRRRHADPQSFQALRPDIVDGLRRNGPEYEAGIAAVLRDRNHRLALRLHLDRVVEGSDADLGAAAHERLQGARPALHIGDLDLEAGILEIAEPLGDRKRQIENRRLAADREAQLRHFRLVLRGCRMRRQRDCKSQDAAPPEPLHLETPLNSWSWLPNTPSPRVTAARKR